MSLEGKIALITGAARCASCTLPKRKSRLVLRAANHGAAHRALEADQCECPRRQGCDHGLRCILVRNGRPHRYDPASHV
jgi:hypothetical protein